MIYITYWEFLEGKCPKCYLRNIRLIGLDAQGKVFECRTCGEYWVKKKRTSLGPVTIIASTPQRVQTIDGLETWAYGGTWFNED